MKVIIQGFINYRKNNYDNQSFHFQRCEMTDHGYTTVMPYEIEVEIPEDFDPIRSEVAALNEEKRRITAAFQNRVTEINRLIQERLAIAA